MESFPEDSILVGRSDYVQTYTFFRVIKKTPKTLLLCEIPAKELEKGYDEQRNWYRKITPLDEKGTGEYRARYTKRGWEIANFNGRRISLMQSSKDDVVTDFFALYVKSCTLTILSDCAKRRDISTVQITL